MVDMERFMNDSNGGDPNLVTFFIFRNEY